MFFENLDIAKTGSIRIEFPRVISRIALKSKKKKKSTTEDINRVKERMCQ